MKLSFILFFVFLCSCVNVPLFGRDTNLKEQIDKDRSATVMLVDRDPFTGNIEPYCSGVWINSDQILTAYHCVHDEETAEEGSEVGGTIYIGYRQDILHVAHYGDVVKEAHPGVVVKVSPQQDLALITINKQDHQHGFAPVSQDPIEDGDQVIVVGHPIGLSYVWVPGTINCTEYMTGPSGYTMKVLHVTASVWFGNSGGGVFDNKGQLLGIASFLMRGPQMSFFIHRDEISKFLLSD